MKHIQVYIDIEGDNRSSQERQGSACSLSLELLVHLGLMLLHEFILLELKLLVVKMLVGLLSESLVVEVFSSLIEGSVSLEEVSISDAHAEEVRPKGEDDDGEEELSEDVVLLLILDVAIFVAAPAVVDGVLLVDPHEVDDVPDGDQGGRNDDHDATAEESATSADAVLTEPDDEERGSDVGRDEEEDVHEREPPGDQIVEHQEELGGDLNSSEDDGENTDGGDTSLDGHAAEAGNTISGLVVAKADAAAALREDGLALIFVEGTELLGVISGIPELEVTGHVTHHIRLLLIILRFVVLWLIISRGDKIVVLLGSGVLVSFLVRHFIFIKSKK